MSSTEVQFYNHDRKERYFVERENTYRKIRDVCRVFFNITKPFEEELEKDCSCFTSTEILDMFSSCATRSWEQLLNFNSQLRIYTGWCIKEGLVPDNQNHYEEMGKYELYNCLNLGVKERMVISRETLEKQIQQFPNVSDQFLALAIFEGISGPGYSDFYNMMPDQFTDHSVKLNGRELAVSTMLIERAKESAEEYSKFDTEKELSRGYRKTDPSIIKDSSNAYTDSDFKNTRRIYRRLSNLETEYGKAYGYVGLRNSGRIDMIKRLMKEDNSTDIRETYDKHKEEIELRYGKLQRIFRWIEENQQFIDQP